MAWPMPGGAIRQVVRWIGTVAVAAAGCLAPHKDPLPRWPIAGADADRTPADEALEQAVGRYHDDAELGSLRAWLRTYPEHPEAETWAELVAQRDYEMAAFGEWTLPLPPDDEPFELTSQESPGPQYAADGPAADTLPPRDLDAMRRLAQAWPDTMAGQRAAAIVQGQSSQRLLASKIDPAVIRFLDGDPGWAGEPAGPEAQTELEWLQARHGDDVRQRLGRHLVRDGCWTAMKYCNWWVARYPDDPTTAEVRAAMTQVWYRRGHPEWKGRNHGYCAHVCVRDCRPKAAPMDDTCFDPCYARCPDSDPAAVLPAG